MGGHRIPFRTRPPSYAPAGAPLGFNQTIAQNADGFMLVARNTWLVFDWDAGPQGWTQLLAPFVGQNDHLYVFEVTDRYNGLAPQQVWNWCQDAVNTGGVTQTGRRDADGK